MQEYVEIKFMRVENSDGSSMLISKYVNQNCSSLREDTPNREQVCYQFTKFQLAFIIVRVKV